MTVSARIAIIGAGHAGICMGMKLKDAGIDDFMILEQAATLGGTWRDNTYPGASCDAPSFLYSFSFAQKTDWSRRFAWQPELLAYTAECAINAGLMPHFRFRTEVTALCFDEARNRWELACADGSRIEAEFVVTAVGQLHRPATPAIPGRDAFEGAQFHSARWDHAVDLTGKRVAVIGNAASAVQFVPQIAPLAAQLTIFQRSANWLMPRKDCLYSPRLHRWMARWPWLARLRHQFQWFFFGEMQLTPLMKQVRVVQWLATIKSKMHLRRQVRDPALRAKLTPDYPIGAKRVLFNDDYYPTLNRANVRLVTDGIECIEAAGVRTRGGELAAADVIIYATGFQATDFLAPMTITGAGGRSLRDEWKAGARAYLGVTVSGFPNLFMLNGTTGPVGNFSLIDVAEIQFDYSMQLIEEARRRQAHQVSVKPQAAERFENERVEATRNTVWVSGCRSWYLDDRGIPAAWPWGFDRFREVMAQPKFEDFELVA